MHQRCVEALSGGRVRGRFYQLLSLQKAKEDTMTYEMQNLLYNDQFLTNFLTISKILGDVTSPRLL